MKTICSACVFAVKEGESQTGCRFNRLEKFEKTLEDGYFVIKGFCNLCRNMYWYPELSIDEKIEKAKQEVKIGYSVILPLYCSDGSIDIKAEILEFRKKIEALKYKPKSVYIIIEMNMDNAYASLEVSEKIPGNFNIIMSSEKNSLNAVRVNADKFDGEYLCFVELGSSVNEEVMENINIAINETLEPVLYYIDNNTFVCISSLFRYTADSENPFKEIIDYAERLKSNDNNSEL